MSKDSFIRTLYTSFRWGSLTTKIILWTFIPAVFILVGVGLATVYYPRLLLWLLGAGVLFLAVVAVVGARRIVRPVETLIKATHQVAVGDFGQTITVDTGDEIEALAGQFNVMSVQLQESYANLEQRVAGRTRELAILNAIAASVNASLDLSDTLDRILDETLDLLKKWGRFVCLIRRTTV